MDELRDWRVWVWLLAGGLLTAAAVRFLPEASGALNYGVGLFVGMQIVALRMDRVKSELQTLRRLLRPDDGGAA